MNEYYYLPPEFKALNENRIKNEVKEFLFIKQFEQICKYIVSEVIQLKANKVYIYIIIILI